MKLIGGRRFTSNPFRYSGVVYGCDFVESRYVTYAIRSLAKDPLTSGSRASGLKYKAPLQIDEQTSAELRQA